MDWFLYDNGLRHERVNIELQWLLQVFFYWEIIANRDSILFDCGSLLMKSSLAIFNIYLY